MHKSTFREYLESILIAAILALFIRTFVFQAFKIPTGSMEPNLLVGDHIIVNKFVYGPTGSGDGGLLVPTADINRGDVIVFRAPQEPDKDFIKRVVAVGGDKVEMRNGIVYVNDEPVDEPYAHYTNKRRRGRFAPLWVPEDNYYCLGDNRDNSRDSRYWGTVPRELVKGRAILVYWSFEAPTRTFFVSGLTERLARLGQAVPDFFTQTRWNRTFHIIH